MTFARRRTGRFVIEAVPPSSDRTGVAPGVVRTAALAKIGQGTLVVLEKPPA